jgi:hypothetical protein
MNRVAYVLGELRCATLRARLAVCDIDTVGIALRSGLIDADTALTWLHDRGALFYLQPTQPTKHADAEAKE